MSTRDLYLEPMTIGMILDRTFRLYVQNFAVMVALAAIVNAPLLAINIGLPLLQGTNIVLTCLAGLLTIVTAFLSLLIVTPLVTGAATKAISERFLGNDITAMSALRFAWGYIGILLVVNFVVGLIIFAGLVLLIVPGILWMLSYSLVTPITVLEKSRSGANIRARSWNLVAGNRGKVFVIVIVVIVAQVLPGTASYLIAPMFGPESPATQAAIALLTGIAGLLTYPLQPIALTLLYYDLRIRKEGFDLEMLSRAIGDPETA